ncbi:MAG: hypothetical protein FJ271_22850 [Planctomycetes bacterium]|nr:hypothetical protein [Planctomycetota bacterium]
MRRLVLIEWKDAAGGERSGWKPIAEMARDKPHSCKSVGWIAHEDDKCLVLVPHTTRDDDGDGEIRIPKDWCQKVTDLIEKPKGRGK